jgi:hypothetical protein
LLSIVQGAVNRQLLFRDGIPAALRSNHKSDQFSEYLVASGVISSSEKERALKVHADERLSFTKALVREGIFTRQELAIHLGRHLFSALYPLFRIKEGTFRFEQQSLNHKPLAERGNINALLVNGIRAIVEIPLVVDMLGGDLGQVPGITGTLPERVLLLYKDEEHSVLGQIDGSRTLQEIVAESGLESSVVLKTVLTLSYLGHVVCKITDPVEKGVKTGEGTDTDHERAPHGKDDFAPANAKLFTDRAESLSHKKKWIDALLGDVDKEFLVRGESAENLADPVPPGAPDGGERGTGGKSIVSAPEMEAVNTAAVDSRVSKKRKSRVRRITESALFFIAGLTVAFLIGRDGDLIRRIRTLYQKTPLSGFTGSDGEHNLNPAGQAPLPAVDKDRTAKDPFATVPDQRTFSPEEHAESQQLRDADPTLTEVQAVGPAPETIAMTREDGGGADSGSHSETKSAVEEMPENDLPEAPFQDSMEGDLVVDKADPEAMTEKIEGSKVQVLGMRHKIEGDHERIVLDLGGPVEFRKYEIPEQNIVYIALRQTSLHSRISRSTTRLSGKYVKTVKLGQFTSDVARLVITMEKMVNVSVFSVTEPDRIVLVVTDKQKQ